MGWTWAWEAQAQLRGQTLMLSLRPRPRQTPPRGLPLGPRWAPLALQQGLLALRVAVEGEPGERGQTTSGPHLRRQVAPR